MDSVKISTAIWYVLEGAAHAMLMRRIAGYPRLRHNQRLDGAERCIGPPIVRNIQTARSSET